MSFSLLPSDELWSRYKASGDIRLRNELSRRNDGLARKTAWKMRGSCQEEWEDLYQIGSMGLIRAIERYNPNEGAKFSSFAIPFIRGEIQHWLRNHWGLVKVSRRAFEDLNRVKKLVREMAAQGKEISEERAALALGISKERWNWIKDATKRQPLANIDGMQIADQSCEDDRERLISGLKDAISRMKRSDRQIVQKYWIQGKSEEQIARSLNMPIEQVRAALSAALIELKHELGALYAEH